MSRPLLSVAIPTYNRERELETLLESIEPQMTDDVEVVVVDNASTDNTRELVHSYQSRDKRFHYFRQEQNVGIDRNVDTAVEKSSATYVWLCGDDDLLEPYAVAHLCRILRQGDFAMGWVNYSSWNHDLSTCERQATAKERQDRVGIGLGQVLGISNFFFSFLSSHVVARDLWIKSPARLSWSTSNWTDNIWMAVPIMIGSNASNFVAGRPLLRQRSSRYDLGQLAKLPVNLGWCRMMQEAVVAGVRKKDIAPFFRELVNGLHLTRNVMTKKLYAPEVCRAEAGPTLRIFWTYPMFWLTVAPLYLLPVPVVRCIQLGYRALRRLQGHTYPADTTA